MKSKRFEHLYIVATWCCAITPSTFQAKDYVDYVNPTMGNISHLLVPTFPTVHLPNSMLRVYPERADYTSEYISGLPVCVTNHRERSAFRLIPQTCREPKTTVNYTYDNEHITPYSFTVDFDGHYCRFCLKRMRC